MSSSPANPLYWKFLTLLNPIRAKLPFCPELPELLESLANRVKNISKDVQELQPVTVAEVLVAPAAPGNFTVPHSFGKMPTRGSIAMTSAGLIWWQPQMFDASSLYLVASDEGQTAKVFLW